MYRHPFLNILLFLLCMPLAAAHAENQPTERPTVTLSVSGIGKEGEVLERQLDRFEKLHPEIRIERQRTPDGGNQRRQLYVQWLNAQLGKPDILQLDVVWTPEFAAAGWLRALDDLGVDKSRFFPNLLEANSWQDKLYAVPWFVDVGLLYWRTDLLDRAPQTFAELHDAAARLTQSGTIEHGFVWQGARYEGLVCNFLEHLTAFGGRILDEHGAVRLASSEAEAALGFMQRALFGEAIVSRDILNWHEEESRKAFQAGRALFMRNWPYGYPLLQNPANSQVAGKFAIAPMPAGPGGVRGGALGGQQLAINARSENAKEAYLVIDYLTAPEQMIERALVVGQFPPIPALYDDERLAQSLGLSAADARIAVETAVPRPVTPVYAELSEVLQVHLHRALTTGADPGAALSAAAAAVTQINERFGLDDERIGAPRPPMEKPGSGMLLQAAALAAVLLIVFRTLSRRGLSPQEQREQQLAWSFVAPALLLLGMITVYPLLWTFWESLHLHDLRAPWLGRQFIGAANYLEALSDTRFQASALQTLGFTVISVPLELCVGMLLALGMNEAFRGRSAVRAALLVPWAIPAVVSGILWRFLSPTELLTQSPDAWLPIIVADVWKTAPFVALLLLAGLQGIREDLYEAARLDGAGPWQRFVHVTVPQLMPTLTVALIFRTLDAFRIFDLIYALTGGGPGSSTESVSLYAHTVILQFLRFGYGSTLAILIFLCTFVLAVIYLRLLGRQLTGGAE